MPDIDKVLEAEKTIKSIATELERMKSAANLMDSAQTKIDAIIKEEMGHIKLLSNRLTAFKK